MRSYLSLKPVLYTITLSILIITSSNAFATPWIGNELSGAPCKGKGQGYGPFDYLQRHRFPKELSLVERVHFTYPVEALIRGKTAIDPYGDLDYTLRAWPNHHRALNSYTRYFLEKKNIGGVRTPPECYFQRAIHFSPKDARTYMLFAMYLQKLKNNDLAKKQYEKALSLKPNDIQILYNYGLCLVEEKEFDKAKEHAIRVYESSFPLNGLKKKLEKAGYWP
ncbi:MAG: tetratricopeptide repeat protein [Sedimenticola sp.]